MKGVVTHVVQLVAYGDSYVRVRHNFDRLRRILPEKVGEVEGVSGRYSA